MQFRRKTFRRRSGRRHGAQLAPVTICSNSMYVNSDLQCTEPDTTVLSLNPLVGFDKLETDAGAVETPLVNTLRKGLLVSGLRFHWGLYPASIPTMDTMFNVSVRLAIVRLAVDGLTGSPVLIPNLFSRIDAHLGDILWRGAALIPWPVNTTASAAAGVAVPCGVGSMSRPGHHGPMEHVKVKRRLDQNQGLFLAISAHSPIGTDGPILTMGIDFFGFAAVRSYQR